jgi:hypothetical protein
MPTQLVLDLHRQKLLSELAADSRLRAGLAAAPVCDPVVLELSAEEFEDYVSAASDPDRAVATGLCHPDEDVVALAALYASGERAIPERPASDAPIPVLEPPRVAATEVQPEEPKREDVAVEPVAPAEADRLRGLVAELETALAQRQRGRPREQPPRYPVVGPGRQRVVAIGCRALCKTKPEGGKPAPWLTRPQPSPLHTLG